MQQQCFSTRRLRAGATSCTAMQWVASGQYKAEKKRKDAFRPEGGVLYTEEMQWRRSTPTSFAPDILGTLSAQLYRKEVLEAFGNDSNCLQRGTAGTEEATSRSPPDERRARNPSWLVNAQQTVQRFFRLACIGNFGFSANGVPTTDSNSILHVSFSHGAGKRISVVRDSRRSSSTCVVAAAGYLTRYQDRFSINEKLKQIKKWSGMALCT